MRPAEARRVAAALGGSVVATHTLAGGFSHETSLLTLTGGAVVARLGGANPAIEAAVMAVARRHVPVPRVLAVLAQTHGARPAMVLEYVAGTPLSEVLAGDAGDPGGLGAAVGAVVAAIAAVRFARPGFFADEDLTVPAERPWSRQLPEIAAHCMADTPPGRLDASTRAAWVDLCTAHAPALTAVDDHARLVHADVNPKNILVTHTRAGWRVDAVLDWEFSYSGCPYGDAANMLRFGADYPEPFVAGFRAAFAASHPADLDLADEWAYRGRVLDMFALSDLVTRPTGHPIADQAAQQIRHWLTTGLPDPPKQPLA